MTLLKYCTQVNVLRYCPALVTRLGKRETEGKNYNPMKQLGY